MDAQALPTPSTIELTAPPPPMRRRLHVPTEPLVFAGVMLVLMLGLARALPESTAPTEAATGSHTVVVQAAR